jgi:hypothetical protein
MVMMVLWWEEKSLMVGRENGDLNLLKVFALKLAQNTSNNLHHILAMAG